ncbi:hypothetical protein LZ554_006283 [Drepanopeziza brunnea f. sp. 'monogermtubi']|nr:hypothetical protein LZ554_006283 [Drepanopeziza brunnea f. sp. 'monogermtubi']
MAEGFSPTTPSSPAGARRVLPTDESSQSSQFRHRPSNRGYAQDGPVQGIRPRRSSNFSDYSLREARNSFQASTDDLLLPKPSGADHETHKSSAWDSVPLAFALLPALGGMLFTNGSSVITDVMLLGLAAIFLNWSVRLPWDWYHSAQTIRKTEEYNGEAMLAEESEDDELSFSQATLEEVPEDDEQTRSPSKAEAKPGRKILAHEAATNELYTHELLALLSCFLFPALGAYLLHAIRGQLTRPSEGLISNYNLTIFLLASELRPMAHLVKLIQARTLHLQRVVGTNPYDLNGSPLSDVKELARRLDDLEAKGLMMDPSKPTAEPTLSGKQSAVLTADVRRSMQPELDALNRAVRRYEKRATLQAFQTESRLHDLESRLNDAISLAAAAANSAHHKRGFTGVIVEWVATAIVIPLQALGALASLPIKTTASLITWGRMKISRQRPPLPERGRKPANGNGRVPANGRFGDRVQLRGMKK